MRNPNGLRTVLLITPPLFLLFPISILVFVLERISYTLLTVQTTRNYRTDVESMTFYGPPGPNSTSDDYDYIDVDININNGPTGAIIGISVVAWLVSVVAVCGIWELRRVEGSARHQRWWSWTVLLSDLAIAIASIAVLAWASVVQGKEGWKGYQDVSKHDQRYTRETWVCQIDRFYSGNDWAGAACGISVSFNMGHDSNERICANLEAEGDEVLPHSFGHSCSFDNCCGMEADQ